MTQGSWTIRSSTGVRRGMSLRKRIVAAQAPLTGRYPRVVIATADCGMPANSELVYSLFGRTYSTALAGRHRTGTFTNSGASLNGS